MENLQCHKCRANTDNVFSFSCNHIFCCDCVFVMFCNTHIQTVESISVKKTLDISINCEICSKGIYLTTVSGIIEMLNKNIYPKIVVDIANFQEEKLIGIVNDLHQSEIEFRNRIGNCLESFVKDIVARIEYLTTLKEKFVAQLHQHFKHYEVISSLIQAVYRRITESRAHNSLSTQEITCDFITAINTHVNCDYLAKCIETPCIFSTDNMLVDVVYSYSLLLLTKPKEYHCIDTLSGHTNYVNILNLLPDGKIVSTSGDLLIKIWDQIGIGGSYFCANTFHEHSKAINSVIILSDNRIASCSDDKTIKLIRIANDILPTEIVTLTGHTSYVYSLLELEKGILASSSHDHTIKVWKTSGNAFYCIHSLTGHTSYVWILLVYPGSMMISGSGDNKINIWDQNFKCIKSFGGENKICSILVLPEGRFALGCDDKTIKVWDSLANDCAFISSLTGHSGEVYSLFLLDNNRFASGSFDNSIKIWDYCCCKISCLFTLQGHNGMISSFLTLKDGRLYSSSSYDGTIKLWDSRRNFMCIQTLYGHTGKVYSLLRLPDGRIVSSSEDKLIKIWN